MSHLSHTHTHIYHNMSILHFKLPPIAVHVSLFDLWKSIRENQVIAFWDSNEVQNAFHF